MKITYITHSCLLLEAGGIRLLMDPWLVGPCWGGNIWHYPPPKRLPEDFADLDYVYYSHAHDDHLHQQTSERFSPEVKKAKVIFPNLKAPYFDKSLRANGFDNLHMMEPGEVREIAPGVSVEMLVNERGDHDSSLIVQADGATVLFQTDNLMGIDEARRIGAKYKIDLVFTIASLTGIFPAFYDFPVESMKRLAEAKRMRALDYSIDIAQAVGARIAVPYASDLCYLGQLYFANDLHVADKRDWKQRALERKVNIEAVMMGPEDTVEINAQSVRWQLAEHDFGAENLAAYAVTMRKEVEAVEATERCHTALPYDEDIAKLRAMLDSRLDRWKSGEYRILWKIVGPQQQVHTFGLPLPGGTEDCGDDWNYDLMIEMPSYRLQRLVRGEYKMGFITMQNGSIRCHRHVENLVPVERDFWTWAILSIVFIVRKA